MSKVHTIAVVSVESWLTVEFSCHYTKHKSYIQYIIQLDPTDTTTNNFENTWLRIGHQEDHIGIMTVCPPTPPSVCHQYTTKTLPLKLPSFVYYTKAYSSGTAQYTTSIAGLFEIKVPTT